MPNPKQKEPMRRLMTIIASIALIVAACGGDPTPGATATTAGTDSTSAESTAAAGDTSPTDTTADASDDGTTFYGNPVGTAIVEIGDTRYEFDLDTLCLTMFGAIGAVGNASDGSDRSINADFPPPDWETDTMSDWDPPTITVDDGIEDISWRAGGITPGDQYEEMTSIEFTSDGSRAYGTATFVNVYALLDEQTPVEGTFEVACDDS